MTPPIRRVCERLVYGNRFIEVYDDDVLFADDRPGRYVRVVESGGRPGVAVLARCGGDVALVRVYRYALDAWEWGVPRGFAQGDDPAATARAELREELGAAPDELAEIGTMSPNSGILSGLVHVYAADYAAPVAAPVEPDEVDEVRWLPWSVLLGEIAAGRVNDSFTLAAVALVTARALAPAAAGG